jgi:hypothetical protein
LANALEQARFEAARAHRQYDEVDPGYRLVAAELERRWKEKLIKVLELEERIASQESTPNVTLCPADRDRLLHWAKIFRGLGTASEQSLKRAKR